MKIGKGKTDLKRVMIVAAAAAILALPFVKTGYIVRFMTNLFMYTALSQVWNILGGFAGYISLGLVGFVGVGAYITGILMKSGIPFYLAILLAGLFSAVVSLAVGIPIIRLKTGYFSIATYAIAYIFRELCNNWTGITGGGMGLSFPIAPYGINTINAYYYYNMLAAAILTTLLCWKISRSSLGYGLMAIKEDEDAAKVLGINTTVFKVVAYVITGFLSGIIGGIYGSWLTFIDPTSAFSSSISILVIIMAMVGGVGTVSGPVIGSIIIMIISEILWNKFVLVHQLILGIILIVGVILLPKGIMDVLKYRNGKFTFKDLGQIVADNVSRFRI